MPDYQKSIIYKLVCNVSGKCYIGSTTHGIKKRVSGHEAHYKHYLKGDYHYVTSFDILKNGNYNCCLIEKYPCDNKIDLHIRERSHIVAHKHKCVNKLMPCKEK